MPTTWTPDIPEAPPETLLETLPETERSLAKSKSDGPQRRHGGLAWLLLAGVALVVPLVALSAGSSQEPKTVAAEKFVLKDVKGKIWAEWSVRSGGPSLALYDGAGRCRASLAVEEDGSSSLSLHDQEGRRRAVLRISPESEPRLELVDKTGKGQVPSSVRPAGTAKDSGTAEDSPKPLTQSGKAGEALSAAKALYQRLCVRCHEEDGHGSRMRSRTAAMPDFSTAAWQTSRSDPQLLASILHGRGTDMPPFDDRLSQQQARDLVGYVRSLGPAGGKGSKGSKEMPSDFDIRFKQLQEQWEKLEKQVEELARPSKS